MKKTIVKIIRAIGEKTASMSAGASVPYIAYQPKMPSKLIKKD
jgi:cyclic lactone autoinducer peptide